MGGAAAGPWGPPGHCPRLTVTTRFFGGSDKLRAAGVRGLAAESSPGLVKCVSSQTLHSPVPSPNPSCLQAVRSLLSCTPLPQASQLGSSSSMAAD